MRGQVSCKSLNTLLAYPHLLMIGGPEQVLINAQTGQVEY
jgi:hypothetical protein